MLEFLRPFVIYDTVIYIILGMVSLIFIRLIWLARRDKVRSIFTLEREKASARTTQAFIGLMVMLSLILGVYYLSLITPTIVPPPQITPTNTPFTKLPPTPTSPPLLRTPTPTATSAPSPTFTPERVATPIPPDLSQGQPPNCPNYGVRISRPGNGARVNGIVQVSGAATIDNFDYYKFEFRIPGGGWNFVQRYDSPIPQGVLGTWNSDTVPPGRYEFRLVVVDIVGNFPEPCVISLVVE